MQKLIAIFFLFFTLAGWAQSPLLTTQWTQDYPYNQFCPEDPMEYYDHSYADKRVHDAVEKTQKKAAVGLLQVFQIGFLAGHDALDVLFRYQRGARQHSFT